MAKFRASARTVDMLGRQQIAGIPTAISELFKNAHDAYASRVEVDFIRSRSLFLLRDNGFGMTRDDFERRWLVLGTESKVGGSGMRPPYRPPGPAPRAVLGEKGIGRLAIGAIGPQVLVLTRAQTDDGLGELVAAFVNWSFFELPGITLEEIEVPIETFPGGTLPNGDDIRHLVDRSFDSFAVAEAHGATVPDRVANDLAAFATIVDPAQLDALLDGPSLGGDGHGTQFFILPASETMERDIDAGRNISDAAPPLTKFLLGFTNTMTPGAPPPKIRACFRDWRTDEVAEELIADAEFFTPDEFRAADHHISGRFDEFGQFVGTVSIYGQDSVPHVVAYQGAHGSPTACGPFSLEVAVVQGDPKETRVDRDLWPQLNSKMSQIGGLYIYRDGIRVLPYGNNDYDFIDIERNRTKNASRYYFSYRRMFGVVDLDGVRNSALQEKAGREGFRENRAYGQFREILKNFFLQTAIDFFREGGSASDLYREEQQRLQAADAERQRQEQLRSRRRRSFQRELSERVLWVDEGRPVDAADEIVSRGETAMREAAGMRDRGAAAVAFVQAEQEARRNLDRARQEYRIRPPSKLGLSKATRKDWLIYKESMDRLDSVVFEPASVRLSAAADRLARELELAVDRRIRLQEGINTTAQAVRSAARTRAARLREQIDTVATSSRELIASTLHDLDVATQAALAESASLDVAALDEDHFDQRRRELAARVDELFVEKLARFEQLAFRLEQTSAELERESDATDLEEIDQEELLALRERADADLELMQLGSAIQVINHEFLANVKAMRSNLRQLKKWADRNAGLGRVYRDLRASFDHLDGYLQLFTPLQRRLYRTEVPISGGDIEQFLRELFAERLERHHVTFRASLDFRTHRFTGYPSTFYPVFVNLVDNAIWWVKDRSTRVIRLDVHEGVMSVRDSGPGVLGQDLDDIFEFGFTRKDAGRGTGLFVSRQVLRREGFDLRVRRDEELGGAAFDLVPTADRGAHDGNSTESDE